MQALVADPLRRLGLTMEDVDKYSVEMQVPEITEPAGAGDVPTANYKMIAALAVMKKQMERSQIPDFVTRHGMPGFAPRAYTFRCAVRGPRARSNLGRGNVPGHDYRQRKFVLGSNDQPVRRHFLPDGA